MSEYGFHVERERSAMTGAPPETFNCNKPLTGAPGIGCTGLVRASGPCLSCGAPAVLMNYDGQYCKSCMQIHLLEKMFVQVTKLSGHR